MMRYMTDEECLDQQHVRDEARTLCEALRWLVNLHSGISKQGFVLVEEEGETAEVQVSPSEDEWRDALDSARRAVQDYDELTSRAVTSATAEQDAHLRDAVVEAALAERRAGKHLRATTDHYVADPGAEHAWNVAINAYDAAVDALLAFLGEDGDAK